MQFGGAGDAVRVRAFSTKISLGIIIITIDAFQYGGRCAGRHSSGATFAIVIIIKVVPINAFGTHWLTRTLFTHALAFLALIWKRVEVVAWLAVTTDTCLVRHRVAALADGQTCNAWLLRLLFKLML